MKEALFKLQQLIDDFIEMDYERLLEANFVKIKIIFANFE